MNDVDSGWSDGGLCSFMDIARIIFRLWLNFWKDLPLTPRRIRVHYRLRRRATAWRENELDRLDRIRNPSKYRGL